MTWDAVKGWLSLFFWFGLGGIAMFVLAEDAEKENARIRQIRGWHTVPAHVIEGSLHSSRKGGNRLSLSFSYSYNGTSYESRNMGIYNSDEVKMLYDRANSDRGAFHCYVNPYRPSEAVLFCTKHPSPNKPVLFRFAGVALWAVLIFCIYYHCRRQRTKKEVAPATSETPGKEKRVPTEEKENNVSELLKLVMDDVLIPVTKQDKDAFETVAERLEAAAFLWSLAVKGAGDEETAQRVRRMADMALPLMTPQGRYFAAVFGERADIYARTSPENYAAVLSTLCRAADMYGHVAATEYGYPAKLSLPHDIYAVSQLKPKVASWVPTAERAAEKLLASSLRLESAVNKS